VPARSVRKHIALIALAAVALCLIVARACLQSVTIDEADSFLLFAGLDWPSQWYPSSGNHVLNSILERLVTSVFGINELTLRAPAILGATVYIGAAIYWCSRIADRALVQIPLFIALVYNPMILDYLVAARGYSLASGFLLAALAVIASTVLDSDHTEQRMRVSCAWVSVFVALSFAANFSFACVDGITALFFFLWAGRRGSLQRLALAAFLPGFLVTFALCGYTVLNWPKGQLYFGSTALAEMVRGFVAASFDDLNPDVVNPLLLGWLNKIRPALPFLAALILVVLVGGLEFKRWRGHQKRPSELLSLARLLVGITLATLVLHWLAFHTVHLLLPKDRTGLFLVILFTLMLGVALAGSFQSRRQPWLGWTGSGLLLLACIWFVGCLQISHFREWLFNADTKQVYWAVDDLNRRCGITDFVIEWHYPGSLNFYRRAYGNQFIHQFKGTDATKPLPSGRPAYVFHYSDHEQFVAQEGLQVVYRGAKTDATVAVRPASCAVQPSSPSR